MSVTEYKADDAVLLMVLETVIMTLDPVRPIRFEAGFEEHGWKVGGEEEPFDFEVWQIGEELGFRRQGYSKDGRKMPRRRNESGASAHQDFQRILADFLNSPWSPRKPSDPGLRRLDGLGPADELLVDVLGGLIEPLIRHCEHATIIRYPASPTTSWVLHAQQYYRINIEISLQGGDVVVTRRQGGRLRRGPADQPTGRDDRRVFRESPIFMQELIAIVSSCFP